MMPAKKNRPDSVVPKATRAAYPEDNTTMTLDLEKGQGRALYVDDRQEPQNDDPVSEVREQTYPIAWSTDTEHDNHDNDCGEEDLETKEELGAPAHQLPSDETREFNYENLKQILSKAAAKNRMFMQHPAKYTPLTNSVETETQLTPADNRMPIMKTVALSNQLLYRTKNSQLQANLLQKSKLIRILINLRKGFEPYHPNKGYKPPNTFNSRWIRWIITILALMAIFLLIFSPILLFVIIPKMIDSTLNRGDLIINSIEISRFTSDGVSMKMQANLAYFGPFRVTVLPTILYVGKAIGSENNPSKSQTIHTILEEDLEYDGIAHMIELEEDIVIIGQCQMPEMEINGLESNGPQISFEGEFQILNHEMFPVMIKELLSNEQVEWILTSKTPLQLQINLLPFLTIRQVPLRKPVQFTGLNNLQQIKVESFFLPKEADQTLLNLGKNYEKYKGLEDFEKNNGIVIEANATLENTSPIGFSIAYYHQISFTLWYGGDIIGRLLSAPGLTIHGKNMEEKTYLYLTGLLDRIPAERVPIMSAFFSDYLNGKDSRIEIRGESIHPILPNSRIQDYLISMDTESDIPVWLLSAIQNLKIPVTLPGISSFAPLSTLEITSMNIDFTAIITSEKTDPIAISNLNYYEFNSGSATYWYTLGPLTIPIQSSIKASFQMPSNVGFPLKIKSISQKIVFLEETIPGESIRKDIKERHSHVRGHRYINNQCINNDTNRANWKTLDLEKETYKEKNALKNHLHPIAMIYFPDTPVKTIGNHAIEIEEMVGLLTPFPDQQASNSLKEEYEENQKYDNFLDENAELYNSNYYLLTENVTTKKQHDEHFIYEKDRSYSVFSTFMQNILFEPFVNIQLDAGSSQPHGNFTKGKLGGSVAIFNDALSALPLSLNSIPMLAHPLTMSLKGMSGLPNPTVTSLRIIDGRDPDRLKLQISLLLHNPSVFGAKMGTIGFSLYFTPIDSDFLFTSQKIDDKSPFVSSIFLEGQKSSFVHTPPLSTFHDMNPKEYFIGVGIIDDLILYPADNLISADVTLLLPLDESYSFSSAAKPELLTSQNTIMASKLPFIPPLTEASSSASSKRFPTIGTAAFSLRKAFFDTYMHPGRFLSISMRDTVSSIALLKPTLSLFTPDLRLPAMQEKLILGATIGRTGLGFLAYPGTMVSLYNPLDVPVTLTGLSNLLITFTPNVEKSSSVPQETASSGQFQKNTGMTTNSTSDVVDNSVNIISDPVEKAKLMENIFPKMFPGKGNLTSMNLDLNEFILFEALSMGAVNVNNSSYSSLKDSQKGQEDDGLFKQRNASPNFFPSFSDMTQSDKAKTDRVTLATIHTPHLAVPITLTPKKVTRSSTWIPLIMNWDRHVLAAAANALVTGDHQLIVQVKGDVAITIDTAYSIHLSIQSEVPVSFSWWADQSSPMPPAN